MSHIGRFPDIRKQLWSQSMTIENILFLMSNFSSFSTWWLPGRSSTLIFESTSSWLVLQLRRQHISACLANWSLELQLLFKFEEDWMNLVKMRTRCILRISNPLHDSFVGTQDSFSIFFIHKLYYYKEQQHSMILPWQTQNCYLRELEHVEKHNIITSSCIISHTKLRSAIEGWVLPSKKRPLPLSQKDSIFPRDAERSFSLLAAASGFRGSPSAGPSVELSTYPAESGNTSISTS